MPKPDQRELNLEKQLIEDFHSQGFFAAKTIDRFKAGKPDLRIARTDLGQLDCELKFFYQEDFKPDHDEGVQFFTGMKKIQWLKIREMNEHSIPAVCLIYIEKHQFFMVTTLLADSLPPVDRRVLHLPRPRVIDGVQLFSLARTYLHDRGYRYA